MGLTTVGNKILVKKEMTEEKTASGLIIPESAQEKKNQGEVIAVGKEAAEEIKVGDIVIFNKFVHDEIEFEGVEYLVLPKHEVWGVIKPDEKEK